MAWLPVTGNGPKEMQENKILKSEFEKSDFLFALTHEARFLGVQNAFHHLPAARTRRRLLSLDGRRKGLYGLYGSRRIAYSAC